MYREPIFPDDWIRPGEFNFCNNCGYHLGLEVPHLCPKCKGLDILPDIEARWQTATVQFRNNIARLRKDAGLPPLFWVD